MSSRNVALGLTLLVAALVAAAGIGASRTSPSAAQVVSRLARSTTQDAPMHGTMARVVRHTTAAAVGLLPLPRVAPPLPRRAPTLVRVSLEARDAEGMLAKGVRFKYWTFNGTVPGPMIRVRQGDTVELTLRHESERSGGRERTLKHSIDLHAVWGPGGGGAVTQLAPGQEATFRFKALYPGVYIYHCGTPPVAEHIGHGMYGLVVVEPPGGFPKVDREYYVMEGEFYLQPRRDQTAERQFSKQKMLDERPDYVVFNGAVGALTGSRALQANVGDRIRIFFGVGGPNLTSSLHVIGAIFDRIAPEGASDWEHNVGVTMVPAGGTTVAELTMKVPGDYPIVDHSLGRALKGAVAVLHVVGRQNPAVFTVVHAPHNVPEMRR